ETPPLPRTASGVTSLSLPDGNTYQDAYRWRSMKLNFKPINEQVIVITGASSGIGLATARAAAAQGAQLVLASRNEEALRDVEQNLQDRGGRVVHVTADVGNRADVQRIA